MLFVMVREAEKRAEIFLNFSYNPIDVCVHNRVDADATRAKCYWHYIDVICVSRQHTDTFVEEFGAMYKDLSVHRRKEFDSMDVHAIHLDGELCVRMKQYYCAHTCRRAV